MDPRLLLLSPPLLRGVRGDGRLSPRSVVEGTLIATVLHRVHHTPKPRQSRWEGLVCDPGNEGGFDARFEFDFPLFQSELVRRFKLELAIQIPTLKVAAHAPRHVTIAVIVLRSLVRLDADQLAALICRGIGRPQRRRRHLYQRHG